MIHLMLSYWESISNNHKNIYQEVILLDVMVEVFQGYQASEDHKGRLDDVGAIQIKQDGPCEDDYGEIPWQNFF